MTIRRSIAFGLLCAAATGANAQAGAAPATDAAPAAPAVAVLAPKPAPAAIVKLSLNEPLTSKTARTGQKFALTVREDVLVGGDVLVPKGATATGTVLFARKKGAAGRSGALDLRVDHVDTPAGRIRLKAAQNRRSEYLAGQAAVVGALLGIFGSLAVQGDDIELGAGLEFNADIASAPMPVAGAVADTATPAATPSVDATAAVEAAPAVDATPAVEAPPAAEVAPAVEAASAVDATLPASAAPATSAPTSPEN